MKIALRAVLLKDSEQPVSDSTIKTSEVNLESFHYHFDHNIESITKMLFNLRMRCAKAREKQRERERER